MCCQCFIAFCEREVQRCLIRHCCWLKMQLQKFPCKSFMTILSNNNKNHIYTPFFFYISEISFLVITFEQYLPNGLQGWAASRVTAVPPKEVSLNKKLNLCQLHRCCSQPALHSKGNRRRSHYIPFKQENLYFMKTLWDTSCGPATQRKMETLLTAANRWNSYRPIFERC